MHPHAWKVFLYTIMTTRSDTNNKHDNLNSDGHGTKPAFHKVHGATESQSANEIASGKRWLEELMKVKKNSGRNCAIEGRIEFEEAWINIYIVLITAHLCD